MIDPATALAFSIFENKGVYALLLGSGVSRAAQIPTGWEIVLNLTAKVAALEGVGDQIDWAAWHQSRFGEPPSYSRLLDALAQTPDERRALLHRFIEPTAADLEDGRKSPTRAHRAIARLVRDGFVRVIITTNFDRLMENALREVGVEPTVVKSDDDLQGSAPLIHTRCLVLKVHGDYLDTRLRNTEGELATYSPVMDAYLDRVFDEHGLIVCGWSADWDDALRGAISRAPSRRYPLFWASRGEPSATARDLINHRGGRVAPIAEADDFFEALQQKVEVQAALERPNPLSLDLLVATAKRYLSRSEFRIQLADLVTGEFKVARAREAVAGFSPVEPWSPAAFKQRIETYEAINEPLARLAFTLGRWGDGSEASILKETLHALAAKSNDGGLTTWSKLTTYPAVLVFTAYGLGAAQAGRPAALKSMFDIPIRRPHDITGLSATEVLFLTRWHGGAADLWKNFEDLERRIAPLSDHLFNLFERMCGEEFLTSGDLELTFEWYEILAGLDYLGKQMERDTLGLILAGNGKGRDYVHMPLGRAGWDSKSQEMLLERLETAAFAGPLLESGFADGDPDFLALMVRNLRKAIDHANW